MNEKDEDGLCEACSTVDLFSLFTGPRCSTDLATPTASQTYANVGTLREVLENVDCPLCHLIKHDVFGTHGERHRFSPKEKQPDYSRIQFYLRPYRADYNEDTTYINRKTRNKVATVVRVYLRGADGCSKEEADFIRSHISHKCGFQLLSPDSVDASRPLLNGFQATTTARSLELLSGWIKTCHESHKTTCGPSTWDQQPKLQRIRLIDVHTHALVVIKPSSLQYAALSYVWGKHTKEYLELANEIQCDTTGSLFLPPTTPPIIENAIEVCHKLGITFLWVDVYCVDQQNKLQKEQDIKNMGLIYQNALVTLVAGAAGHLDTAAEPVNRLLPSDMDQAISPRQLVEEIRGKKYITTLMPLFWQMVYSHWSERGWTYQEGALAQRVAFFGGLDVSFICGSGHWRESLHSGPYGHDASLASASGVDVRSRSRYTLSTRDWLDRPTWTFSDYKSMLWLYSTRQLSYEADKINAISGCLNMLGQRKGVQFVWGLPSVDFHYALLWNGAYDRPRPGFPSWSWAGWHARQNFYAFSPVSGSSGGFTDDGTGKLVMTIPPTDEVSLLGGLSLKDMSRSSRCLQTVSDLEIHGDVIAIRSEVAHFRFEILNTRSGTDGGSSAAGNAPDIAGSKIARDVDHKGEAEEDTEMLTSVLFSRIRVTNTAGIECRFQRQCFPKVLRASTLAWLERDGVDLVRVVELRSLECEGTTSPFHYVFCLGVDRHASPPGRGRRLGWYVISVEDWARACPQMDTVMLQ